MSSHALQLENEKLRAQLAERDAKIVDRDAKIDRLARDLRTLEALVKQLLSGRRRGHLIAEGQGVLFPDPPASLEQATDDASKTDGAGEESDDQADDDDQVPEKRRKGACSRPRKIDTSALPCEERVHELPEEERVCPDTGQVLVPVGEKVFDEIDFQRAKLTLIRHRQVVYGLAREQAEERQATPVTAPMPPRPLENCVASAMLLAWLLVQKYANHRVPRRRAQQPKGRRSKSCCIEDEGRPLGIGVQAQVSNHLELLGSRARVVSVEGNGVARPRQVRSKKTSASEPLMTCREVFTRRRNRAGWLARDESRGYLSTDWVASGMKAA